MPFSLKREFGGKHGNTAILFTSGHTYDIFCHNLTRHQSKCCILTTEYDTYYHKEHLQ